MHRRVSPITLSVADVAKARAFDERRGWTASSASEEQIAFFQVGSLSLALYPQDHLAVDIAIPEPPSPGVSTLACNVETRAGRPVSRGGGGCRRPFAGPSAR